MMMNDITLNIINNAIPDIMKHFSEYPDELKLDLKNDDVISFAKTCYFLGAEKSVSLIEKELENRGYGV